jgi:hypothetical protein
MYDSAWESHLSIHLADMALNALIFGYLFQKGKNRAYGSDWATTDWETSGVNISNHTNP